MKNLSLCDALLKKLEFEHQIKEICYGYNEDSKEGEVFACSYNLILANFNRNGKQKWIKDLSDGAATGNTVVNVTLLTLNNSLCVGLGNGEIFNVGDGGNDCELVGVCDAGIQTMEWSPDQELLVLITKEHKMILMSYTYDSIHEVILKDDNFGEGEFITVGWGKKETQFHGSEGKNAAKIKVEISADLNAKDLAAKITWRGDGQLYAVGFTMEGIHRFKVFNKEGILQYTSEKQPGLEANLAWRPSGNVIATTQRLPDKYVVAFFEKNGLKHGGFDIPVSINTVVKNICWSSDSEVIALHCLDTVDQHERMLIFTTGNYHWYLKQSMVFNDSQKVNKMLWDNEFDIANNKRLHIFFEDGGHLSYNWIWNIDHSVGLGHEDDGIVGVIDGTKILLTGFKQSIVPPPMCALEINTAGNVNEICFYKGKHQNENVNSNSFFIVTEDSTVVFYKQVNKSPLKYDEVYNGKLNECIIPLQNYNWLWVNENIITCIQHSNDNYNLVEYNVQFINNKCTLDLQHSTFLPDSVMRCETHPTAENILFLHLNNGEIVEYTIGGFINPMEINLPTACPKFTAMILDKELIFIGLSHKGNLYFNDNLVMNNVSSFFIHTHFLLLTTLQHLLLCTELTPVGIEAIQNYQKTESPHVYKRNLERGSKLVIAVPNDTRTVFQLPRGNLEAIQPRPLSLKIIGQYLDELKYHEAFDLMRKQRINLNLIHDHNPQKFVDNINVFLENTQNNSWLSLFLSDLDNSNVTETMYSSSYAYRDTIATENNGNKITNVCDLIRQHIEKRLDRDSKILPLLTAFVKLNTTQGLEKALEVIKQLKVSESQGITKPVSSDEALKYLLYMVDVNDLFLVALGMYDFDLVLFVATKSQKDPKEYVPMLNELNEMEENYKRFSINKHLKRFDKAVEWLAKCGPEKYDELLSFIKYHSLYRKGLEVFDIKDEIYKQIENDYGMHLKLNNKLVEAGIFYKRATNIEKAVECFKDALEWELAVELAQDWPKEKFQDLCRDLVAALNDEKRHAEGLRILELYTDDIEQTILFAIRSGLYSSAFRLCTQHKREDFRDSNLKLAVQEECLNLTNMISTNSTIFHSHVNRLRVVRENKVKHPVEYDGFANKDCDLYSDAGSTVASSASRSSSRTFRSSKNRRKHERKIASIKEGSRYEDVALVRALYSLITSTAGLRTQARQVTVALVSLRLDEEASKLQESLDRLLKDMKDNLKTIWSNEFTLEATNAAVAAFDAPEGSSVLPQGIAILESHIRIPPIIQDVKWTLDCLK